MMPDIDQKWAVTVISEHRQSRSRRVSEAIVIAPNERLAEQAGIACTRIAGMPDSQREFHAIARLANSSDVGVPDIFSDISWCSMESMVLQLTSRSLK